MQDNRNPQNFMQQISALIPQYCDRCGAKHVQTDFEVVFNEKSKVMCRLSCSNCGNIYMIQLNGQTEGGVISAKRTGFKSEITQQEMDKFSDTSLINTNEIIDVYDALKAVKTIEDFNKLF
jgi:uncharacterized Zn finger protein